MEFDSNEYSFGSSLTEVSTPIKPVDNMISSSAVTPGSTTMQPAVSSNIANRVAPSVSTTPSARPSSVTMKTTGGACQHYIDMIKERVGKDEDGNSPMNILVLGPKGVGKSSFICSLGAALSEDRWREHAYIGSHGDKNKHITKYTDVFEKCCNSEKYKDYSLPTFVDIAGLEDENNDLYKELIKIVLFGRMAQGKALHDAYKLGMSQGINGLKEQYKSEPEKLRIDRVIFITSATEEVPEKLIDCVLEAARPAGEDDNKRSVPLFGVMTKYDQVGPGKEVEQHVFDEREKKFIEALGLPMHRYVRLFNYCDDVDPNKEKPERLTRLNPEIDEPLLNFMTQVCDSAIKVINPDHPYSV